MRLLGRILGAVVIIALVAVIALLLLSWLRPETASSDVDKAVSALQSGAQAVIDEGQKVLEGGKQVLDNAKDILPGATQPANTSDPAQSQAPTEGEPKNGAKITPEEAKERMEANKKAIILDVRTQEEYNEKHIPKAKLLPVDDIIERAEIMLPDKDAEILVYCQSGVRASSATKKLVDLGYTKVYNFGGIINWPFDTE